MIRSLRKPTLMAAALVIASALTAHAQVQLIATSRISGTYQDLSNATGGLLENGVPGNQLGGMGSAIAYAGGDTFLMLPDRGPNAVSGYGGDPIDNTVSYINRFHTFTLRLEPNTLFNTDPGNSPFDVTGLPYTLTPTLSATTLLHSAQPLVYGTGGSAFGTDFTGKPTPPGAPALNATNRTFYFTGRSDNFDPRFSSTYPFDARFDTEGMRVSNDGRSVFISDEYGPYVYQFDRATGERIRFFTLPPGFAVAHPNTTTASETGSAGTVANTSGRIANKGMEGLAITPDGRTLVGAMQSPLIQDGGTATGVFTRIVVIDIQTGAVTHQYAYKLESVSGSAISEILAVNDHQFLVDERDGTGFETANNANSDAVEKKLFEIDLNGATDVSKLTSLTGATFTPVTKTLFLDVVQALVTAGFADATHPDNIPSKLEGIAFGPDLEINGQTKHTLFLTNDNDFLPYVSLPDGGADNPNRFFVFSFADSDLPLAGKLQPQQLWP